MFDNVAFEVVIGLVFIYLLYSLLITILGEMVATQLGIRARLLRIAIERMMNDGYYLKLERNRNKRWQGWIRKIFLYEPVEFAPSFAGRFYDYPAIKYLSRIEDNYRGLFNSTKPSYISPDYFAESLISFLMDKGNGITDMDRIRFTLRYNTHNIQPKTLKQFRNLFESSNNDRAQYKANLIKWFNETMDRANGWHKRKMRMISFTLGFLVALFFNINSIYIAHILSNDKQARDALVTMGVELSKNPAGYEHFVTANGDTVRSEEILDSGYARIQRDIDAATFIMGVGWQTDTLRKKDSITIDKDHKAYSLLRKNESLYNKLRLAEQVKKQAIDSLNRIISVIRDSIKIRIADSVLFAAQGKAGSLDSVRNDLTKLRQRLVLIPELLSKDSILLNQASALISEQQQLILPYIGKDFVSIAEIGAQTNNSLKVYGERKLSLWQSIMHILYLVFFRYGWVGLLLTGIALSMGAPFWFDLLNKLISVRGVGIKPEEKKSPPVTPEPSQEVQVNGNTIKVYTSDPVEYALFLYRDALEAVAGVLAVNYEYRVIKEDKKTAGIEVSVSPACDKNLIPASYEVTLNNQTYSVPVFVIETGAASLHVSFDAKNLLLGVQNGVNSPSDSGWGTVTGVVMNKISNRKAILSCAHVLRGSFDEVDDDKKRKINDHTGNTIGTLYYYVQSNNLDAAYADTSSKEPESFTLIKSYQEVVRQDAEMETEIIMDGFVSGKQEGRIINHRTHFPFQVNGRLMTMVNLVKITRREGDKRRTISTYGDSGALVTRKSDNMPLAMIIGGTDEFSFAISLKEVFESLYIEPLKDKV